MSCAADTTTPITWSREMVDGVLGTRGDVVRAFASVSENLIQAVNIVGSIFYGVVLGLVLVAFFVKSAKGTAVFWGAITAQALVFVLFFILNISYLWYNVIGCAACMLFGLAFQNIFGFTAPRRGDP